MRKPLLSIRETLLGLLIVVGVITPSQDCTAQALNPTSFANRTNLLGSTNFSGVAIGIADMNGDGRDDIVRYNQGTDLNIQYQTQPRDFFDYEQIAKVSNTSEWSTAIGDVDRNGYNDIIVGGAFNNLKLIYNQDGQKDYVTTNIQGSNIFIQGINFVDIDNDGALDIFACNDLGDNRKFRNNGSGIFFSDAGLIDTETAVPSDNSGNYSSIWTDYDNDGDLDLYISKCKVGANSYDDPRRVNMLMRNNGDGSFSEVANNVGLRIGAQTWTTDFADIDNDGDMDAFVANHYDDNQLFVNNGDGTFTDITVISGLNPFLDRNSGVFPIQTLFRDFNNDGYVDLLFTGDRHFLFYNNGNRSFSIADNPFGDNQVESVAVGDLDHNGFLDVYAGYAELFTTPSNIPDEMYLNNGNGNNFIAVQLEGTASNINAIGARVEIYGDWGIQVREVRSGEGYGIMNSFTQHFGLGTSTTVDKIVVKWPNGNSQELNNPGVNAFHIIIEESDCVGSCNDGNPCTINDTYDADCNCSGFLQDSDGDGICDAEDFCPNFNNNLIGTVCNDGDPCTSGETWDDNCGCTGGTVTDNDNDGICAAQDADDSDPCVPVASGSDCEPTETECIRYAFTGFENQELGVWIDGGSAANYSSNPVFAATGNGSFFISGNFGIGSSIYTGSLPLSDIESLVLSFSYLPLNMVTGDGFVVEYASDGNNYQIIETFTHGAQFTEFRRAASITIANRNFTNQATLRIRTTSAQTSKYIMLDDISIDICAEDLPACIVGATCDDDNPCTSGETLDANCNCSGGTIIDTDNDGVCDTEDNCPSFDNNLIGQSCSDADPCTTGETWDNNCGCSGGVVIDNDGDGFCSAIDSNDNDPCVPDNSNCTSGPVSGDCTTLAFAGFENGALGNWQDGGTSADLLSDANFAASGSYSLILQGDGGSQSSIFTVPLDVRSYVNLMLSFDLMTFELENGDQLLVEYSNDEFNYTTYAIATIGQEVVNNSRYKMELQLTGIPFTTRTIIRIRSKSDSQSDFWIMDNLRLEGCSNSGINCIIGTVCDDGNACTIGSVYDSDCNCVGGTFLDSDNDGVCDLDDNCPNFDNALIGQPCNDGNPCTTGETWSNNCGCTGGIFLDNDGDGFCLAFDPDDNDPCIPDNTNNNCDEISPEDDCALISFTDFENLNFGIWNDGGDGGRHLSSAFHAQSGDESFFIQGNLGAGSSLVSDPLNLTAYESILVEFHFFAFSMEGNDRFHLEIGNNGVYTTARTFTRGTDFNTNDRISASLILEGYTWTVNTTFRFRAETNGLDDFLILDDIRVSGCGQASNCAIGTACIDGDPCTIGETLDQNCNCTGGVYIDMDQDGLCIGIDLDDNDACVPDNNSPACDKGDDLSCEEFMFEDFENNTLGIWISGGTFGSLLKSETFSNDGSYIFYVRGNAGQSSSLISPQLGLNGYEAIQVSFDCLPLSMEADDSFVVEIAEDGLNFQLVKTYAEGIDFTNEMRFQETLLIDNFNLTNQTRVRVRATADNDDYIIIDEISVSRCSQSLAGQQQLTERSRAQVQNEDKDETDILIYPNPTTDVVTVSLAGRSHEGQLSIYNSQGQEIVTTLLQNQSTTINLTEYKSGLYLFVVQIDGQEKAEVQRVIKQ
jgi:hypothetical protein